MFSTHAVDSDVPSFENCPSGPLVFSTPPGEDSAIVTWGTITANDTADGNVPATPNFPPGTDFVIGVYTVVYQATDSSGNVATCSFDVEVRGTLLGPRMRYP